MEPKFVIKRQKMIKIQKSPNSLLRPFPGSLYSIYAYLQQKMTRRASLARLYRCLQSNTVAQVSQLDRPPETDGNIKMTRKSDDISKSINSFWEVEVFLPQFNHRGSTRDLRFVLGSRLEVKSMRTKFVIKGQKMIKIQKSPNSLLRPFPGSLYSIYAYLQQKMTRRASLARLYRCLQSNTVAQVSQLDRPTETDANVKMIRKSDDISKSLNSFWEVDFFYVISIIADPLVISDSFQEAIWR